MYKAVPTSAKMDARSTDSRFCLEIAIAIGEGFAVLMEVRYAQAFFRNPTLNLDKYLSYLG